MSTTNNSIRRYLHLPVIEKEFDIYQVDSLRVNSNTLMFISNPDVDLLPLHDSTHCVYLLEEEEYLEVDSECNDFIRIENSKYKFCKLVEYFQLYSRLQNEYNRVNHRPVVPHVYCTESYLGLNCHFDEGVIIGGTDFSPVLCDDGITLTQFPQLGGVIIGDNVIVKYNTMIGKGTFGYTKIGDNTMIDYGCQVGHNCIIGSNCIIAAGTIIGGSTTVGDSTVIGIGAKIRNGIHIGSNCSIGMGSVVVKDIPDGSVVLGNPAKEIIHKKIFDRRGLV